jgi:hypothetical protein
MKQFADWLIIVSNINTSLYGHSYMTKYYVLETNKKFCEELIDATRTA